MSVKKTLTVGTTQYVISHAPATTSLRAAGVLKASQGSERRTRSSGDNGPPPTTPPPSRGRRAAP